MPEPFNPFDPNQKYVSPEAPASPVYGPPETLIPPPAPPPEPAFVSPHAGEDPNAAAMRKSSFRRDDSGFLDPQVLDNLQMTEPVAEEIMARSQKEYEKDLETVRKQDPKAHFGFDAWLSTMSDSFQKMDPKSEEGKAINSIGMAELYREFMRLHQRTNQSAMNEELKGQSAKLGAAGQTALAVWSAADEYAKTASGGLSETAAMWANKLAGGEEQARKYQLGREFLTQLQEGASPTVRYARGLGGLLPFIQMAGGVSKMANLGRVALEGGKTALTQGTWRYGLNKGLATLLGATGEGAGMGSKMLASAGNFLATDASLKVMNELNDVLQLRMANDPQWKDKFAALHASPGWDLMQSALSGAVMPIMGKLGDAVARRFSFSGGAARKNLLTKTLREMGNTTERVHAVLARGAGGSAEFLGLSVLPNVHDPRGMFGVTEDFADLFGADSEKRTKAIERLMGHAINGFFLKNLHGRPVNEGNARDRAQILAPEVMRSGVGQALTEAQTKGETEINSLFPTASEIEDLRLQKAGDARDKVADFVVRQYANSLLPGSGDVEGISHEAIMDSFSPEQQQWVTNAVNDAIKTVVSTGKGVSMRYVPEIGKDGKETSKPKIVSYGAEAAHDYNLTPDERRALQVSLRGILEESTPEERDALATNLIQQQAVAEAAAGMGMTDAEKGAVDSVLSGIADSAAEEARVKEGAGVAKPEESLAARKTELEGLYRQMDAAQQAGDLGAATEIAKKAAALEGEVEKLDAEINPPPEPAAGTAENPLTPGVKPKPLSEPAPGDTTWPPEFIQTARGQQIRVLVGQTGDKQGIFRNAHILHVDDSGVAIAQTVDGTMYAFTPSDVGKGAVRGEILTGIEPAPEPPKTPVPSAAQVEHDAIRRRGDSIEPVTMKPGKVGEQQGPSPISGLIGAGKTPPKPENPASPTKPPETPPASAKGKTDVTPSPTGTSARLGSNRQNKKGPSSEPGPTVPGQAASTGSVEKKGPTPGPEKPKPPVSEEAKKTTVPTPEWVKSAPDQDINAKIGVVGKYLASLTREGKKDSDEAVGARSVLSTLAKEAYRRRNPEKPKAPADPDAKPDAAGFAAEGAKAKAPAKPAPAKTEAPAEPAPAEAPARLGSNRAKARLSKEQKAAAKEAGDKAAETAVKLEQAQRIIERSGKKINDERAANRIEPVTGVSTRASMDKFKETKIGKSLHWGVYDLTNLGILNNNKGDKAGDAALKAAADKLVALSGVGPGRVFRSGGDEFAVAGTPEQLVALGNALSDFTKSEGLVGESDTPYGKIHNRLIGGVAATYDDATKKLYGDEAHGLAGAKREFAAHSDKHGFLNKVRDPSKGWRPRGAGAETNPGPFPGEASAGTPSSVPTARAVVGMKNKITLSEVPAGMQIVGAIKSGQSVQVFVKDADDNIHIIGSGGKGLRPLAKDATQPVDTKNVIVVDPKGETLYKAPTEIEGSKPAEDEPSDTGKIESRDEANARLGSFRRKGIEKGERSQSLDPVRKAYIEAGAMAADPSKPAAAAKMLMDTLYGRITAEENKPKPNAEHLAKLKAAYHAISRVHEAKQYIEKLDERIRAEGDMIDRTSKIINPARLLSSADFALDTSQRSARDLAAAYKTRLDERMNQILAGRPVKSLPDHLQDQYTELRRQKRFADSLLQYTYTSKDYGRVDLRNESLPHVDMGDMVEVIAGGPDGTKRVRGLVVGVGNPTGASLKRGIGPKGQLVRELRARDARGETLTEAQRKMIADSDLYPGRYVTIYSEDGGFSRIRTSDISDIGPQTIRDVDFSYDPETLNAVPDKQRMGKEVTDTRFLSWFEPPAEAERSRSVRGAGDEEQSLNRVQMLSDGEEEGYFSGDKEITGEEAAKLEAKNTASKIRNRTAREDQYAYQAMAMLVDPKDRRTHTDKFASRNEDVAGADERYASMTPEQKAAYEEKRGKGGKLPEDTFDIKVHYFKPGAELRKYEDLTKDEQDEYDRWEGMRKSAEAERMDREKQQGTFDENERILVPLHSDGDKGEWLIQRRLRGKGDVLYQGQTLLAERTPEGTIFVRRISPTEAEAWMTRHGKKGEWEEFRKEAKRNHDKTTADNNKALTQAGMETQLRDYLHLMRRQFAEIINGRTEEFKHEGDLHKQVREWVKENPAPEKDTPEYEDWLADAERFLFKTPDGRKTITAVATTKEGGRSGEDVQGIEGATYDQPGERGVGGPLYRAAERVREWREPNWGGKVRVDESGNVVYLDLNDKLRDFYVANQEPRRFSGGIVLGTGLGGAHGKVGDFFRAIGDLSGKSVDWTLRNYHKLTNKPAGVYTGVMDGVTNFTRAATDTLLFDRIHDILHDPEYGQAILREKGKEAALKMGTWFGESDVAPMMRIYHNDLKGEFLDVGLAATNALKEFRQLPFARQRELIDSFERGEEVPLLAEYKKIIDQYGIDLEDLGIFSKDTTARFKGKYVSHSRWIWKYGDIEENLKKAKEALALTTDAKEKGRMLAHVNILTNALSKATKSKQRVFLGDHPLQDIQRDAITSMIRKGFVREREHLTVSEAEKKGLDTSVPWALLMDGLLVEGRARAQARMIRRVLSDPNIVKSDAEAPSNWVPIEGTRYANDALFKDVVGMRVEPQALSMLEALNPDRNKFSQAVDFFSAIAKSGLTVWNPTNWHTQILGNYATLATRVPFFQIPSRLAQALQIMNGVGKGNKEKLEKYKRFNWTRHTGDAVGEMARMLDQGQAIQDEGGALKENPYLGMGFFQSLREAMRRFEHGHFKQGFHGVAKGAVDVFTSLDAIARIALHEYNTETMKMDELESRKMVDKYFDIENLPKGWKQVRRYVENFVGIKAAMLRNLPQTMPGSISTFANMALMSYFWNMAVGGLTGTSQEDQDSLIEASIPNNNAFHNYWGKKTALLMPDMKGTLRVVDMNKYTPMDTGIRAVPGLRPLVSGAENLLYEGRWAKDMDGKGFENNIADFISSNLLYGPQIDWVFNRDRYNPNKTVRDQMEEPGAFGRTGYLRYMIERGNLPAMFAAALPPGVREVAAGVIPTGVRDLRRVGEASDTGFLGTPPRYVTEKPVGGEPIARKYDATDAMMEAAGFSLRRPDEYERVRELLQRTDSGVTEGQYGLEKRRGVNRATPESDSARQTAGFDQDLTDIQKAVRLVAMIKHYKSLDTEEQKTLVPALQKMIKSRSNLHSMIAGLARMEEYDLSREINNFFESDASAGLILAPEPRVEKMTKDRLGSYRNK